MGSNYGVKGKKISKTVLMSDSSKIRLKDEKEAGIVFISGSNKTLSCSYWLFCCNRARTLKSATAIEEFCSSRQE